MDNKQILEHLNDLQASVEALKHANVGISTAASSDKSLSALEDNIFMLQEQLKAVKSSVQDDLRGVEARVGKSAAQAATKPVMSVAKQLTDLVVEIEKTLEEKIKDVDRKSQDRSMSAASTVLKVSSLIEASAAISSNHLKSYLKELV